MDPINVEETRRLVASALEEDGAADDVTCGYLGIEGVVDAAIVAGAKGVIAGLDVARIAFETSDPEIEFDPRVSDGARVVGGDIVVTLRGRGCGILAAERVALNFLQRLSGVATLTAAFVTSVGDTGVRILDTRKTTPLLRRLEKYAVRIGGGENHRYNLSDMLLVKENHFRAVGGTGALIERLKKHKPPRAIEVEVDSLEFLDELLGVPVDRIMLDNFSPGEIAEAVRRISDYRAKEPRFKPEIEVSGGINLHNVREFALPGVDFLSIGALTHSAPALDLALEVMTDAGPL